MKIKGVKTAVGEYKRFNKDGYYSPAYGYMMLDRSTGSVWTDYFYSLGHNEWKEYHDKAVIRIDNNDFFIEHPINMANVREYATKLCQEYANEA